MARPRRVNVDLENLAQIMAVEAIDIEDLRCAQAILLPALLGTTLEQTALLLGVGRASVHRLQVRMCKRCTEPDEVRPSRGGRRHASLTLEEEKEFLSSWAQTSNTGEVLIVSPIREALAQKLGHPVSASVVYRMLSRHGWRKVAPDTRHPKSDPKMQDEWKKTP